MNGDETTDEESSVDQRPSSSSSSPMTQEEMLVMRRVEEKLRTNDYSLIRIRDVRKIGHLGAETIFTFHVTTSPNIAATLVIRHSIDPCTGVSRFSVTGSADWLSSALSSDECKSLNCIFQRIVQLVEQRRLDVLMSTLNIAQEDEEPGSGESISSGTTAASPQSSRSTTTSIP